MLQCCENPKIKITDTGDLFCETCSYSDFRSDMWAEETESSGFIAGAYRHNSNLWSAGAEVTDTRQNIYACKSCGREYASTLNDSEQVCCCGTRYELLKKSAEFLTIYSYNRYIENMNQHNSEIEQSEHDCTKYQNVSEFYKSFANADEERFYEKKFIRKVCGWCGKTEIEEA